MLIGLVAGLLIGSVGTAAANNTAVQAIFSSFTLQVEGVELPIEPLVHEGSTYLPVRQVAGMLGFDVSYTSATRTIGLARNDQSINAAAEEVRGAVETLTGEEIINLVRTLYPDLFQEGNVVIDENGLLQIGDVKIQLEADENGEYSIDPLLESGVLSNQE
ncbi:stalk domain-containing protein [Bacillus horti]|nr:stalk domain-containing protein [Bacillus horti]